MPFDIINNKGHNVYYMLPLLLGILGLLFQAYSGEKGIQSFWVTFFLFFMTGLAIVLYLNQTPYQPRERDYAYAGSFYAFCIWIGFGTGAIRQTESGHRRIGGNRALLVHTYPDGRTKLGRPRPFRPLCLPRFRFQLSGILRAECHHLHQWRQRHIPLVVCPGGRRRPYRCPRM